MKKYLKYIIFILVSIIIYFIDLDINNLVSILESPYTLIGNFLRRISLLSGFGNILAIVLYILIALIPVIFLILRRDKLSNTKKIILVLLAISQFITIYYSINPHLIINRINQLPLITYSEFETLKLIMLAGLIYINYIIICIYFLVHIKNSKNFNPKKFLLVFIDIITFLLIVLTISFSFKNNVNAIIDGIVPTLISVISILSLLTVNTLVVIMLLSIQKLFIVIDDQEMSKDIESLTTRIINLSFISVFISLLSQIILIITNYLLLASLSNVNFSFNLPLGTIILALICMLLAKYFRRVNELNEDHSLII